MKLEPISQSWKKCATWKDKPTDDEVSVLRHVGM